MAPITGAVNLAGYTAGHVPQIHKLQMLLRNAARLMRLMTKLRKKVATCNNYEFDVQERRPRGDGSQINFGAGYPLGTETSLVVDSANVFSPGDLVYIPRTGETLRVNDVNYNTNTLDVTGGRSLDAGAAAALLDDDYIMRVARVMAEGYTVGASYVTGITTVTNYVGTVSTPVEWTNHQLNTWSYLSEDQRNSRMDADRKAMAIEHLRDCNKLIMFSEKSKTSDSNGNYIYTPTGVIPGTVTNSYNHSGGSPITEDEFIRYIIEPLCNNDSDSTDVFVIMSGVAMTEVEGFGRDYLQMSPDSKTLGFPVKQYMTGRRTFNLVHEPVFDRVTYYSEALWGCDLEYLELALMQDTKLNENIGNKKDKRRLDEWETQLSVKQSYEETCLLALDLRTGT